MIQDKGLQEESIFHKLSSSIFFPTYLLLQMILTSSQPTPHSS